jgi:hypothetical protein
MFDKSTALIADVGRQLSVQGPSPITPRQAHHLMSVTYGREIPPRLNPNVAEMIDQVKACYADLTRRIVGLQDEIVALIDAGKLDHGERTGLLEHYRHLQDAVDAATADVLKWPPSRGARPDFI